MLWYGYIYYFTANTLVLMSVIFLLRLFFLSNSLKLFINNFITTYFLGIISFFLLTSLILITSLMTFYQDIILIDLFFNDSDVYYMGEYVYRNYMKLSSLNNNLIVVYTYPFIYIFLLITVLSIIFCLSYNKDELSSFMLYVILILISGYVLFFTDSFIIFFLSYEMLLIPSFFILYKFAKTRRCVEAAYLMFFWTQFGALFLIFVFIYIFIITNTSLFSILNTFYFSEFETNFIFSCVLIGFGVKLPIWPFYGWLPKAHVEASTNFSIFLSGVLVKFAFFGLMKCLFIIQLEPTFFYIYPFLAVGIIDAVFKLFYQIDLKKLVAYSTVVEMHWLTFCVISGQSNLLLANFCMLISHALLSTNSFLLVDAVARRFKTRLITEISGINFLCPKLFIAILLNTLIFLGFPGSIFFISEVLFFSFFFDLFPVMTLLLILFLYLIGPSFFFRSWVNLMFGQSINFNKQIPTDLTSREFLLFFGIPLLMYWLGFSWQSFVI